MKMILGLLSLCWLLGHSRGMKPGAQCVIGSQALHGAFSRIMLRRSLLRSYLEDIVLPDIRTEDPAGPESGFTGLRIVNTQGRNVSVKLSSTITENGFFVMLRLDIRASALLDGVLSPANISTEAKLHTKYGLEDISAGTFEIIFHGCDVQLGDVTIELWDTEFPVSGLPMVRDSLTANLPAKLCPRLKAIFDRANELLLHTVNVALPFDPFGTLHYRLISLPVLTNHDIRMNFSTQIVDSTGLVVSIPEDAVFIEAPPIQNYKLCLGLQEALLNLALSFLVKAQPLHLEVIPEEGSGSASDYEFPSTSVLYLKIIVVQSPEIAYRSGEATLHLILKIEMTLFSPDRSLQSILTVKGLLELDATNSVLGGKLVIVASLSRLQLLLESSEAGISDVSSLVPHCESLLSETLVPMINAQLHGGLPLPSVLNSQFSNSSIQVIQGAVVLCV